MFQVCLDWLEKFLAGERGGRDGASVAARRCRLRVCFDGRGEAGGGPHAWPVDLTILPAVWHKRCELLSVVTQLLARCAATGDAAVELLVLYDAADPRMAQQCAALRRLSQAGMTLVVEPR